MVILYSYDFLEHEMVIQEFATFLHNNNIDVMIDLWDHRYHEDQYLWYEKAFCQADKIIVIHSEGAYRKYMATLQKDEQFFWTRKDL